jgi:lantibiotic modifying enzyme
LTIKPEDRLERGYLESARGAARWIVNQESILRQPGLETRVEDQLNLYYGKSGILLFFLELSELTRESYYFKIAAAESAYVCREMARVADLGFYTGLAGMAFSLAQMVRATGNRFLLDSLNLVLHRILSAAQEWGSWGSWNEVNDLFSGTAGIGLALISLASLTGRDDLIKLAEAAGARLLSLGRESRIGRYWTFSQSNPTHYPNFSHGTAGIGYFFAELYKATRDRCYYRGAVEAGFYLQAAASGRANYLICHDDSESQDLFYLGWCHGPAGTGRFFYRLYQVTGDHAWLELVKSQAATILASGIPERQTPGYWNNVSRCCGAASVGEFFLGLYRATGEQGYLAFAERAAGYLVARKETDERGTRWTQAENRVAPHNVAAQTGLMQGAAGIGMFLVHVEKALRREKPLVRFPDEPEWECREDSRKG